MKTMKCAALFLALACLFAGCGVINSQTLTFALGPAGGDFYALGEPLSADLTKGVSGARFNPVESGGSADNARLLASAGADVALMTADAAAKAAESDPKLRVIAPLFGQALHVVATGTSGIRSLHDLKARRVSLGTEGEGTKELAEKVVAATGLELRDLQRQYLAPGEAFDQMKSGSLDACFVLAAPGSAAIAELAGGMDVVILPFTDEAMDALLFDGAFYEGRIPAESYRNQTDSVAAAFVDAVVVCTANLSEGIARGMAAVLSEKAEEILKKGGITRSELEPVQGVPLHEGLEKKPNA